MINKIFLGIFILYSILSCSGQSSEIRKSGPVKRDSVYNESFIFTTNVFEILEYNIVEDTLLIVSTSDFLYYPFGGYKSIKDFSKQFSFMKNSVEYVYPNNDSTLTKISIYRFSLNQSYIILIYDNDKNRLEIIAAKIFDSEVSLSNQVKIGITKLDFIEKFTDQIKSEQVKNVKVIKFASGVLGIWHYYIFENNVLSAFNIDTDYQFNKN